jgi:acetylornithine deacetylase/succinyl-diaminopimelate desuccinylase-like protein
VPSKITRMSTGKNSEVDQGALRASLTLGAPQLISDLARLVRIPSVSWDGFDAGALDASAEALRLLFEDTGMFDSVGIYNHGDGKPAVIARREPRSGAPTVVLYAHHDVQPPGAIEDWESGPFDPVVRHGRLYGRGSADDKAGIAVHLAALRALVDSHSNDDIDLGVVVFVEGEEENGSPSFAGFLRQHKALLAGDVIVVADSDNPSPEVPAITTSLRGNVTAVLRLRTLTHAVHSGMFGGVLPDAMTAFVALASTFFDGRGSLAIAGLHASPPAELEAEEPLPGSLPGVSQLGHGSISDRLWRQAALTVTGIDAPSVLNASNTLLPEVRAKLSLRVPPGVRARDALAAIEAHIGEHVPFGAHWELTDVSLGEPFVMGEDVFAVDTFAEALGDAFGHPAVFQGVGGSIPFISQLATEFPGAQIVVTGVEDPDTRAHSPNESLHLGVLWRAALGEALFLARLNRRRVSDFL